MWKTRYSKAIFNLKFLIFNACLPISRDVIMGKMVKTGTQYNLEERTTKFAEDIVVFTRKIQKDTILVPILLQLIRAGTSIGANYQEANGAISRKDFLNKIHICKKEAKETTYWLRILEKSVNDKVIPETLKQESKELVLIFSKIASSARGDENS
jgi:four helix bundle protein